MDDRTQENADEQTQENEESPARFHLTKNVLVTCGCNVLFNYFVVDMIWKIILKCALLISGPICRNICLWTLFPSLIISLNLPRTLFEETTTFYYPSVSGRSPILFIYYLKMTGFLFVLLAVPDSLSYGCYPPSYLWIAIILSLLTAVETLSLLAIVKQYTILTMQIMADTVTSTKIAAAA